MHSVWHSEGGEEGGRWIGVDGRVPWMYVLYVPWMEMDWGGVPDNCVVFPVVVLEPWRVSHNLASRLFDIVFLLFTNVPALRNGEPRTYPVYI